MEAFGFNNHQSHTNFLSVESIAITHPLAVCSVDLPSPESFACDVFTDQGVV
jgi:hypothetical protein